MMITFVNIPNWAKIWSGFGALSLIKSWSGNKSMFGNRSGFGYSFRSQSGIRNKFSFKLWIGSAFGANIWVFSQIENHQNLHFVIRLADLKITDISALKPRIISKQKRLGIRAKGNKLEVGQDIQKVFSEFIEDGVPALVLKEIKAKVNSLRIPEKTFYFCLVGEEFWLVLK